MKKITLLVVLIAIVITSANATVWRVSNKVINGLTVNADFSTLQSAINGASSGDTLYMMGSQSTYGNGTFSKQLVVIGPGYWLNDNDSTQAVAEHAKVGQLSLNAGSEGTILSGLYIYKGNYSGSNGWKLISINTDSITLKKNLIHGYASTSYTYTGYSIYVNGNRSNIVVNQNWIKTQINDASGLINGTVHGIYFSGIPSLSSIKNNFIRTYKSSSYGNCKSIVLAVNDPTNDLIIYNNVFWGDMTTYWTNQLNNIFISGSKGGGGDLMMNNLCSNTQYPDNPPTIINQQNVVMDSVFVDYDLYIDNGYLLKANSPAIGAGVNGGDCGVFGYQSGGIPYVLSGLPAIPAIYEAIVQSMGANSVSVTIKAKSHNESN